MNRTTIAYAILGICLLTGVSKSAIAAPEIGPWGLHLNYVDRAIQPGEDFFRYSNGEWLKTAEIPPDRTSAGAGFEMVTRNEDRMKEIVADLHSRQDLNPEEQKLRDLYDAFIDREHIESLGMKAASKDLERIASIKTREEAARLMGDPSLRLRGPFLAVIGVDDKHPDRYTVFLTQSGLGMPDRDYYLRDDKNLATTRDAYKKYLEQMLGLAGVKDAAARAAKIYAVEHDIAVGSWPAADRRQADKIYNPMTLPELVKLAPGFPWTAYFEALGIPVKSPAGERGVIVSEKSAFPAIAKAFGAAPVAVWRDYLTVRYLSAFAAFLPRTVDDTEFAFAGTVIQGRTAQLDRTIRGARLLDAQMGEALGKIYVRKYFPPEAKAKIQALVRNLLLAFEEDLKTMTWMTDATRAQALDKLHRFTVKVGYPDQWRDYSAVSIDRNDLIGSVKNAIAFEWSRNLSRLDGAVDRTEWGMTPPTVNAYNNSSFNEIVFPAGILQPPHFDPSADDAVNYGGIGAVIGHEISHGFDDQGSKYDGLGVLRNWWTDADRKGFDERTSALAAQYDGYEGLPGLHVNGKLTLGENIADLAGLRVSHRAYQISLGGKEAPVLDGLNGDQRFYLAFGQSWRSKTREGAQRQRILSNPHSPPEFRVNGVVRNDDGWYAAFPEIKPESRYYLAPERRIRLW